MFSPPFRRKAQQVRPLRVLPCHATCTLKKHGKAICKITFTGRFKKFTAILRQSLKTAPFQKIL